jgi:hypothetical protein
MMPIPVLVGMSFLLYIPHYRLALGIGRASNESFGRNWNPGSTVRLVAIFNSDHITRLAIAVLPRRLMTVSDIATRYASRTAGRFEPSAFLIAVLRILSGIKLTRISYGYKCGSERKINQIIAHHLSFLVSCIGRQ